MILKLMYWILILLPTASALHAKDNETLAARIDSLVNAFAQADIFSGNVIVSSKGSILYRESFGYADWETKRHLTDTTMFNIGSNGKDFTQTLICQLVQEGVLSFDDPLGKFVHGFPAKTANNVTIRHLLTMRSGMGDYMSSPRFAHGKFRTISEIVDFIKDEPLFFEPGTDQMYSNSGYVVLGGIIETLTGKSYFDNVHDRILKPLHLTHTAFIFPETKVTGDRAMGTEIRISGEKTKEIMMANTMSPTSAGGMYSSCGDMLQFYQARLETNRLLNDAMKLQLFSRYEPKSEATWAELLADDNFRFGAAGGLNGWNSVVIQVPSQQLTVIVLSNFDELDHPAEQVGRAIVRMVQGKSIDPPSFSFPRFSYRYIMEKGIADYTRRFENIVRDNRFEIDGPMVLNRMGYDFIALKKTDLAVEIFKLNTQRFPDEANCFDSLGEAYWLLGNKTLAIENYTKALGLARNDRVRARIRETIDRINQSK